jgi:Fe-S-cluster containining protein
MTAINEFSKSFNEMIDDLDDALQQIGQSAERGARHISKNKYDGRPVSCHRCTEPGCCYQKIGVHLWEVLPIARELIRQGRNTPELRAKLRETGDRMEATSKSDWFDAHVPCVFLENKRCTIYSVRPVNCRTYFVFSPPEYCSAATGTEVAVLANEDILDRAVLYGRDVHTAMGLRETNKRMLLASLPRALDIMLEALDRDDWREFIRRQHWPSDKNMVDWFEGVNPIRERLYQIRTAKSGQEVRDDSEPAKRPL